MDSDTARRLEDALELSSLAERMVAARARREAPDRTPAEVEAKVLEWLQAASDDLSVDASGEFQRRK